MLQRLVPAAATQRAVILRAVRFRPAAAHHVVKFLPAAAAPQLAVMSQLAGRSPAAAQFQLVAQVEGVARQSQDVLAGHARQP